MIENIGAALASFAAVGIAAAVVGAAARRGDIAQRIRSRNHRAIAAVLRYIAQHPECTAQDMIVALDVGADDLLPLLDHLEQDARILSIHQPGPDGSRRVYVRMYLEHLAPGPRLRPRRRRGRAGRG